MLFQWDHLRNIFALWNLIIIGFGIGVLSIQLQAIRSLPLERYEMNQRRFT